MAAPLDASRLDDAIERYLRGQAQAQILADTGVSATTLHRERNRRGIPPRRNLPLDVDEIVSAYLAGESEYAIANRLGVSRGPIRQRLRDAGIDTRDSSEAGLVRASKLTKPERVSQAESAHDARRGQKVSNSALEIRARNRQRDGRLQSNGERLLAQCLAELDQRVTVQQAVGKYNVDMAVGSVAVEVLGGGWHATKRIHATRTPYILDRGWNLLFVWNQQPHSPITAAAADYAVTFDEEARWQPSTIREYRVITGQGQLLATGSANDGEFTLVPPPRGSSGRRTRHYGARREAVGMPLKPV